MGKTLLASSIILAITGCVTNNTPTIKSSPAIQKVQEVRALSSRNSVALEWDMVNKSDIAGYYIQRSADAKKYINIATIDSKYTTHFTDTNLKPNTQYYYKISTFNTQHTPSFATLKMVKTVGELEPISYIVNANLKAKGMVKIVFRPHPNENVKGYYVQRFDDEDGKWREIANLTPRLRAEYIDKDLKDGKIYKYRIIAYTFDGIKSKPSKIITTKTLEKPKVILDITPSTNLLRQIELKWKPVPKAVKYKIYSSSLEYGWFTKLATTNENKYLDIINKDGATRYYKISSIDKYGIESFKSQVVMGSTLDLPKKPIVSIQKNQQSVEFILSSSDQRAIKYLIKKDDGNVVTKIHDVQSPYLDRNIQPKKSYSYKVYAIDENGLVSDYTKVRVEF